MHMPSVLRQHVLACRRRCTPRCTTSRTRCRQHVHAERAEAACVCAQAAVYPKVNDLTYPLPQVDIRVHCLYGTGQDTDEGYVYAVPHFNASAPPPPKEVRTGLGDGTVNLRSLEACTA